MDEPDISAAQLDLGTGLGHSQAFGLIASQCSAAQALSMRQIRDSGSYKSTGLTWEEFCPKHFGLTRRRVETIIENLEEFGETYFHLCQIVRISPENYRHLAPKIDDGKIEIAGEMVPMTTQNSGRIRRALAPRRTPPDEAGEEGRPAFGEAVAAPEKRLDAWFAHVEALKRAIPDPSGRRALYDALCRVQFRVMDAYAELAD